MGTVMTHRVFGAYTGESIDAALCAIERYEALLSRFSPSSEISRVNRSAGIQVEGLSPETFSVLSQAVEYSRKSCGCFDVTIGSLVDLWNIGKHSFAPPHEDRIRRILPLVNYRDLLLDPRGPSAGLRRAGQVVDLGGIGKGFVADEIRNVFCSFGISSAVSNLGGNVVTIGSKPDGSPWRVGIQHPRQAGRLIGSISVVDRSVVTSGDYQRCATDTLGTLYHHILDPCTGYPVQSGLASVSVVSKRSVEADALATMLFVTGLEKGLEVLGEFHQAEAVFVGSDLRVYITKGIRTRFQADRDIEITVVN
jgi:thiamine biosynthesis lipoprotein